MHERLIEMLDFGKCSVSMGSLRKRGHEQEFKADHSFKDSYTFFVIEIDQVVYWKMVR